MNTQIDRTKFGPWVLITGASSGIGKEFASQLAAQGFHLVLVARRQHLLEDLAAELERKYGIETQVIAADLADKDFIAELAAVTDLLDIGLVISNAGVPQPGEFIKMDIAQLQKGIRVNVLSHLFITRYYGEKLIKRQQGGIILVSAFGSLNGIPFLANSAATKAYVFSLGLGLHTEFKRSGVSVLVMSPGAVDTAAIDDLHLRTVDATMKPMAVGPCVEETLRALQAGKAHIIPGRVNRVMNALVPASFSRDMFAKLLAKGNGIPF